MLLWTLKAIAVSIAIGGVVSVIGMLIDTFRRPPPKPIENWQDAFNDSRARGLNTEAYTFQIAWAYAKQHFESAETK